MAIAELTGQRNSAGAGSVTTISAIYPSNPTEGNLLVACLSWRGNTTISGVPSGWNLATNANGTDIDSAIYYKIAGAGEGKTHDFTLAASQKAVLVASEWSGISASPLDKTNSNSSTSGPDGTCGLTGTLAQADELVICAFSNRNIYTWGSYDNGAAEVLTKASTGDTAGTRNRTAMSSRIVSDTASINYGATLSTTQNWCAAVATFKAVLSQSLSQSSRFDNSATFYAPNVTRGSVTLTPALFSSANNFYAPSVAPGAVTLTPGLITNTQDFYAPTVSPGSVSLLASRLNSDQIFYSPSVSPWAVSVLPVRFDNDPTFFALSIDGAVPPQSLTQSARLDNSETFYSLSIALGVVTLTPGLLANEQDFYAPSVSPGAVSLLASRFDSDHIFYSPVVVPGAVSLQPASILTNQPEFFAAVVDRLGMARVTTPAYFVEIAFSTTLRLSSRGNQVWNGYTWTGGRLGKVQAGNTGGQVELMNSDLLSGALVLNEGIADRAIRVWAFEGDDPGSAVMIFAGVGDKAEIRADRVRITLVTEKLGTLYSPRRFVNAVSGFHHLLPAGTKVSWGGQTLILDRK